jgi:serine/threonine protein kinase
MTNELVERLVLPYATLATVYRGPSEVRRYRNTVTKLSHIGKRVDLLGLDDTILVHEARFLKTIQHRNIVPVLEVAEVEGRYPEPMKVVEMIMPYYPRRSVCDAFNRGERFSLGEARSLVLAALRGLAELHEVHRIIHRDIKSPNLLLSEDADLIKIGDLGIAAWMDEKDEVEPFAAAHPYVPPETYMRDRVGRPSDIYGLGLVLFEAANGPLPYAEYTTNGLAQRLEKGRPGPPPRHLRFQPWVPRRLRAVIRKATALVPEDRYRTAHEMSSALARVHIVDWRGTVVEDSLREWEGTSSGPNPRKFRVTAEQRRGRWRLSGRQYVSAWRRLPGLSDGIVEDLYDAADFFESILERSSAA